MSTTRFDAMARLFAARRASRRAEVRQATPRSDTASVQTEFLFVQSFQRGTVVPKAGEAGTYTLTLEQGLGQTVYFSDRPDRIVGAAPTPTFLRGIGFGHDNPPNAALVAEVAPGETALAVVELFSPVYDEATSTATYDVKVLADFENSLDLGFTTAPADLATVAPTFDAAHLFIDDCPDITTCFSLGLVPVGLIPGAPIGTCWNSWTLICDPCDHRTIDQLQELCNETFRDGCGGSCVVYAA